MGAHVLFLLACPKPWIPSPAPLKILQSLEIEAEEPEVRGYPHLHGELEGRLGYVSPCLKTKAETNKGNDCNCGQRRQKEVPERQLSWGLPSGLSRAEHAAMSRLL